MYKAWIIVADKTRARVLSARSRLGTIEELHTLTCPEGRLPEQALNTDKPGRSFDSNSHSRHAMEKSVNVKTQQALEFAGEIADLLEQARHKQAFEKLILVAAPEFLGYIREKLSESTSKCVIYEVNKNITQLKVDEIRAHLPNRLPTASKI